MEREILQFDDEIGAIIDEWMDSNEDGDQLKATLIRRLPAAIQKGLDERQVEALERIATVVESLVVTDSGAFGDVQALRVRTRPE